jgi:osmoprotectant transport system substrate-binding protein
VPFDLFSSRSDDHRSGLRRPLVGIATLAVALPFALTACGSSSNNASTPASSASGVCTPKTGTTLQVLTDDKHSQSSDNIVPVVNSKVAQAPLTTGLNSVSKALTQTELVALNTAVSIDRQTASAAAKDFVSKHNLGAGLSGGKGTITVASVDFPESTVLANVYAEVLSKAGYTTKVTTVGTRQLLVPALSSNQVQVTPEYAASLTSFLAKGAKSDAVPSGEIDKTIATLTPLAAAKGLTVLTPAPATDQNAFAVTQATAQAYGLTTLSDLASKCSGGISLGGPPECPTNSFCQPALEKVYGLKITKFTALDAGGPLTKNALKQGKVLVGEVFTSDPDVAG